MLKRVDKSKKRFRFSFGGRSRFFKGKPRYGVSLAEVLATMCIIGTLLAAISPVIGKVLDKMAKPTAQNIELRTLQFADSQGGVQIVVGAQRPNPPMGCPPCDNAKWLRREYRYVCKAARFTYNIYDVFQCDGYIDVVHVGGEFVTGEVCTTGDFRIETVTERPPEKKKKEDHSVGVYESGGHLYYLVSATATVSGEYVLGGFEGPIMLAVEVDHPERTEIWGPNGQSIRHNAEMVLSSD